MSLAYLECETWIEEDENTLSIDPYAAIKSNKNFTKAFVGINLELDGENGAIAAQSGGTGFIVEHKDKV